MRGPQNETVVSQSSVNFSCTSYRKEIDWKYAVGDDADIYIFKNQGRNERWFDARFGIHVSGLTSVLTIHDTRKNDSGTYSCHASGSTSQMSARLIVVGKYYLTCYYFYSRNL